MKKVSFQVTPKFIKLPADFTLSGREFHTVGPATEKDLDQMFFDSGVENEIKTE